ncbi:3-oxoacyl-[acyl-carrier-protein] synthase II [Actinoplanes lutulentus]|uniref:3-oxoacyl-[acyl-carrier-protein] synthase II n=1 Tax=Actinoplanes lutulentus TaxID=1287878 RepID=A0A327ZIV7_9ACTN|nr:beta-ketoacyl-[acyl-carrier-protein] synthase family protein [Actinoplanes lutulentus]MBB2940585.1 3-oxoacyl-[acyl-carrier-protein] synthase II [Actinoplanes lutulentus]RAK42897.1 3-oxoacyl-[acyl-carrier-protein] synthase II [Actinoplanes lutulentus]
MAGNEVVVTGLEVISPLGSTAAGHWDALLKGRSGVAAMRHPWAQRLPVRIAGEVSMDLDAGLSRPETRRYDRVQKLALSAARQAWKDAGLYGADVDTGRLAVCIGTGMSGVASMLEQSAIMEQRGPLAVSPTAIVRTMGSAPAACVGVDLGARAGVHSVSSACASGTEAIARAAEIIRSGRADVVLAGGAEASIVPQSFAAFHALRALSLRNDEPAAASRPWDARRDGFVMGEGAGMLVLENARHALARGAHIRAVLTGTAVTSDGHDLIQPRPGGQGLADAITFALRDAGLDRTDVTHVNAHATGTQIGDLAEADAIRSAVGEHPVLTANKSATGHLLGAAGAVEAAVAVLTLGAGMVPPTINLDEPGAGIALDVVTGAPRMLDVTAVLKTSLGFGGHNVALLFTRW